MARRDPPALLVVGVEEPDKAGFKVFQRLQEGRRWRRCRSCW